MIQLHLEAASLHHNNNSK